MSTTLETIDHAAIRNEATLDPNGPEAVGVPQMEQRVAELLRAFRAARAELLPLAQAALGDECYSDSARPLKALVDALESEDAIRETHWRLSVEWLCRHAEARFTPPSGVPLEIDRRAVHQAVGFVPFNGRHGVDSAAVLPPLAAVWAHLRAKYGTEQAQAELEAKAVRDFIGNFLRRRDQLQEPKWRKGRLVLEIGIWTEKRFAGDGYELTYSSREYAIQQIQTLRNVLGVIGASSLSRALARYTAWGEWMHNIVSRERTALPQDSALITYLQKIEIEIGADVAADLMARVSAYLAEHAGGAVRPAN